MDTSEAALQVEVDADANALGKRRQGNTETGIGSQMDSAEGNGVHKSPVTTGEFEAADERTALLSRASASAEGLERTRSPSPGDFDGLPWYQTPSIYWIIGPFFLLALAFGGTLAPKLNLILELVCREYMAEKMSSDPGFTQIPVDFNDGDNAQCRIPEVQSRVAALTTWGTVIAGALSAIVSPKLGALSDRYGRKFILVVSSCGTICGEVITIFAARYPETFPSSLILLGYGLDGLTGSILLAMSISNAYITDVTTPQTRSVAFGYLHACLFLGIAAAPILAGLIVKLTQQIIIVFYVAVGVHISFVLYITFIVPESLHKKRRDEAHKKQVLENLQVGPEWDIINVLRGVNILEPLKILWPTGPGTSPALRRNLVMLAAVDTIVFGVAMGALQVLIIYLNYMFGWKSYESGIFISIVNTSRVFSLIVVLPILTYLFRRHIQGKDKGCDEFDLGVIRMSVVFDTLGFLGYTLSRTGGAFTASGAVAAFGGIGSPTLQSALTKHVPAEKTGQLLGAVGLLHSLARVVAPTICGMIYSATVGKFSQAVFVVLCGTFFLAFVVSLFIRPHVYYGDTTVVQETGNDDANEDDEATEGGTVLQKNTVLPIIGSITAALGGLLAFFGLASQSGATA